MTSAWGARASQQFFRVDSESKQCLGSRFGSGGCCGGIDPDTAGDEGTIAPGLQPVRCNNDTRFGTAPP
jgi:hypothetical protein